jgi:hypothetical protein
LSTIANLPCALGWQIQLPPGAFPLSPSSRV